MSKKREKKVGKPQDGKVTRTDEVGEGNHDADRRYREATEQFIAEGKVAPAAAEAVRAVEDAQERRVLERAEERGRAPAAPERSRGHGGASRSP